jgi:uncharacterized protein
MTDNHDHMPGESDEIDLSRRNLLAGGAVAGAVALAFPRELIAALAKPVASVPADLRFPYFQSTPVPYFNVKLQDTFWAPRQKTVHEVTVPWATAHWDAAGGLNAFRAHPETYQTQIQRGDLEVIRFLESMAAVTGLQRDKAIDGLTEAWGQKFIDGQLADGYSAFGWPLGADPKRRWTAYWWSHEDLALGRYVESAIAFKEATGRDAMYGSAVRGVDNMASVFLGSHRAYAPGHEEIEQALMRLYGLTGNTSYLQLCGWLIEQRGHHEGRPSFGKYSQDHVPVRDQRTIEGHAVRAAFLYNGVTEYVGATGDAGYREAVLAVWKDFADHKMYLHGAGGLKSAKSEGYGSKPDFIPPDDCYGESCSVFGNFEWAHNLARLTGDASYLDVAERMLYNAFYASLSLQGDRYFYENAASSDSPMMRFAWHPVPCCVPNIVTLFSTVGGFFYSTDKKGIFVNHYGASEADIPFGDGVKLIQRTDFPWDGTVTLQVEPKRPTNFSLRLRVPAWAKSHTLTVNGTSHNTSLERGWVMIQRHWKSGDTVELSLSMEIERVTMPQRFKEYNNLVALQRGPIVYCLEEQDIKIAAPPQAFEAYLPADASIVAEHHAELLGGVTVLRTDLRLPNFWTGDETSVPATFIPYAVWNNRTPGAMRIWLTSRKLSIDETINEELPSNPPWTDPSA